MDLKAHGRQPVVGLFGGTFDPPHLGHFIVAQDVAEALALDELRFVVAAHPPHKADAEYAPAATRARMVEAAVHGDRRFCVSRIELEREGPSYTVDTLRALREADSDAQWRLIIGVDQLEAFHTWREPEAILAMARLVVIARDGIEAAAVRTRMDIEHDTVEVTRVDVSSTGVRRRIAQGRPIRYLVPDAVRRIIEDDKLYAAHGPESGTIPDGDTPSVG